MVRKKINSKVFTASNNDLKMVGIMVLVFKPQWQILLTIKYKK